MTGWPALAAAVAAAMAVLDHGPGQRLRVLTPTTPRSARTRVGRWPIPQPERRGRSSRRRDLADAAISVPSSLALELRSGHDVATALLAVADEHARVPDLARRLSAASAVATTGGDPAPTLAHRLGDGSFRRRGADQRAAEELDLALRPTAACLSAAHRSGLPIAVLLDSASASAAGAAEISALARAELAGARASAYLLAALPLAGVGLGQLLGARPVAFLVTDGWGRACLLAACLLTGCGALWNRALAAGLTRELA